MQYSLYFLKIHAFKQLDVIYIIDIHVYYMIYVYSYGQFIFILYFN